MKTKEYTLEEIEEITGWDDVVSFKKIEKGLLEITDGIGYKKIYSKNFKKELTWWFKEDYFIKDGKIFKMVKIGEMKSEK